MKNYLNHPITLRDDKLNSRSTLVTIPPNHIVPMKNKLWEVCPHHKYMIGIDSIWESPQLPTLMYSLLYDDLEYRSP
eukprot:9941562-Prorocentrum_lima.AAC.1